MRCLTKIFHFWAVVYSFVLFQHFNFILNETKMSQRDQLPLPFFTPELHDLVQAWERSSISLQGARRAIWDIIQSPSYKNHLPNSGIVFVKTTKTASSTITSVLHALATSHNLTMPISTIGGHYFKARTKKGRSKLLSLPTTIVGRQKGAPYDIWTYHVKFSKSLLSEAVPTSDGKFFSIVREPAARIRSACNFYRCCPAQTPEKWHDFVLESTEKSWKRQCGLDYSFREINEGPLSNETQVAMEDEIRKGKLLLLVTDRLLESMLALWDFYNLHPLDVAFFPKKFSKNQASTHIGNTINLLKAEEKIRKMNPYDTAAYKLANMKLSERIEDMFSSEVIRERAKEELKTLNDLLHYVCQGLDNSMPELKFWCLEKELDNFKWCEEHLKLWERESKENK